MNRVSAPPNVIVTPAVLRALQSKDAGAQTRLIDDMSKEVAFARLSEQSRLAIRMLRTGVKEPNVQSYPNAPDIIDQVVNILLENMALIHEAASSVKPIASKTVNRILIDEEQSLRQTRPIFNATPDNDELKLQ